MGVLINKSQQQQNNSCGDPKLVLMVEAGLDDRGQWGPPEQTLKERPHVTLCLHAMLAGARVLIFFTIIGSCPATRVQRGPSLCPYSSATICDDYSPLPSQPVLKGEFSPPLYPLISLTLPPTHPHPAGSCWQSPTSRCPCSPDKRRSVVAS